VHLNDHLQKSIIFDIESIYLPVGMQVASKPQWEPESAAYGACRLVLGKYPIAFRIAKATPKKVGYFVTIWKRLSPAAAIVPLDIEDEVDFVVISVHGGTNYGHFVFSKKLLVAKGIMSVHNQGGKRAIRVYPPWSTSLNKTAAKTQQWQLPYFLPLVEGIVADTSLVHHLFNPS
jgi:hypothetical protein